MEIKDIQALIEENKRLAAQVEKQIQGLLLRIFPKNILHELTYERPYINQLALHLKTTRICYDCDLFRNYDIQSIIEFSHISFSMCFRFLQS